MKTNEAPEKIFIVNDDLNIKREWYKTKQVGFETTEYTRTDTFIEKAWDWVEDNLLSSNQQDKSRLYFEQFKNYMKGE